MNIGLEDEFKEFKKSTSELEEGLISLVSMLNKHCGGTVYFGVDDKGDVIGQDVGRATLKSITQAVANFIDPRITPEVKILKSDDGKRYISLHAKGYDRPYLYKSQAYIRHGEEDRKVNRDDTRKMYLSYGDMLVNTTAVQQELTFDQLADTLSEHGLTVNANRHFYGNMGLHNQDRKFNIQAELLSDQNNKPLTVVTFMGLDKTRISHRKEYGGMSLIKEVRSVIEFIENLNERSVDVTGPVRKERDLFNFTAFKEAWINACVHNNWIDGIPPTVHIFDDRMEIVSYGGKPYRLSEEEFFEGRSMPVNESLMRTFIAVGLCEHTGHGVPVVTKFYGKEAYRLTGGCVTVTLMFTNRRIASQYRSPSTACLSKNEHLVLSMLAEHPDYSLDRVAEFTGLARPTVGKIVPELRKRGLVERKGSNRDGVWIVHANML